MTYLTRPVISFIFTVEPFWLPLLVLDVAALLVMIFAERFSPRTLIFWITVVAVLPFLGFILYLIFGCTLYSRRLFSRKSESDARYMVGEQERLSGRDGAQADTIGALGADVCTTGNAVRFFWDRSEVIPDMVRDIRSAQRSVHLMARRLPRGMEQVHKAAMEAVSRGVDVCIMTSSLGFGRTPGLRRMRKAGVRYHTFHRIPYSLLSVRPANRNMRSMAVIDGHVAYQGRGAAVRIEGPAAARLERRFMADWAHATGERMVPDDSDVIRSENGAGVQVVSDGPDLDDRKPLFTTYSDIIIHSERTLYMAFPYLLPTDEIYSNVKLAVASGVDVRILLPRRGKHWYQSWNSLAASNPLMRIGAKVYFADRTLGKCVIILDGRLCCVGSGDFSSRPLAQDFNTDCLIYSEEVAEEAGRSFMEELGDSAECHPDMYDSRSVGDMFRIAIARLLMFFN